MKHKINDLYLKERLEKFSPEVPYRLLISKFPRFADVTLHYHDCLEFNIYHELKGKVFLDGMEFSLADHSLLILPPGTMHSYLIPSQKGEMLIVQLSLKDLNLYLNTEQVTQTMGIFWERIPFFTQRSEIPKLCYRLMEKERYDLPDFLFWVLELFRAVALLDNREMAVKPSQLELSWLRKVINYTELNFDRKITLNEVAVEIGFSSAYFSRLFKKNTGFSYWNYLQTVRLERAAELLKQGLGVSETAELSGFQDVSYFIKVFRENRGLSPGQYKTNQ
ncbi:MAG: helix-turn-helix domain-containing protein [Spirochaetales bacterium]|nr:helix-turn-helix domain-containing protein [Spirochaetales bacterium]